MKNKYNKLKTVYERVVNNNKIIIKSLYSFN